MTKRAFDKIMASVNEARAHLEGTADNSRYRAHAPRKRKPTLREMGSGIEAIPTRGRSGHARRAQAATAKVPHSTSW